MDEPTDEEEKVLQEADTEDYITIDDIRKHYSEEESWEAARRMVSKDLIEITDQPGRYRKLKPY